MLTKEELQFLRIMVIQLHKETSVDRYVIAEKLLSMYHPGITLSYKDISYITNTRDVRRIEQIALEKIQHPLLIKLLEGYPYE